LAYFTASGALKILLLVGANPILTDLKMKYEEMHKNSHSFLCKLLKKI